MKVLKKNKIKKKELKKYLKYLLEDEKTIEHIKWYSSLSPMDYRKHQIKYDF